MFSNYFVKFFSAQSGFDLTQTFQGALTSLFLLHWIQN